MVYEKVCVFCKREFSHPSRNARYCSDDCQKKLTKLRHGRRKAYRADSESHKIGILSRRLARMVAEQAAMLKVCIVCDTDLEVELHHKSGNVLDNRVENLSFLCKKHHDSAHSALNKGVSDGES